MAKRKTSQPSRRDREMIELSLSGQSNIKIGKKFGVRDSTVCRVLQKHAEFVAELKRKDAEIADKAHEKVAKTFAENLTAGMEIAAEGFRESLESKDPKTAREYLENAVGASKHTRLLRGEAEGREELIASPELISRIKTFREAKREA